MNNRFRSFLNQNAMSVGIMTTAVLLIVCLALTYWNRQALIDRNEFVDDRVAVDNHINKVELNVMLQDLGLRGYFMIRDKKMLVPYEVSLENYTTNLDELETYAEKYNYDNLDSIDYIKKQIRDYSKLVTGAVQSLTYDNIEAVVELFTEDPGYDVRKNYNSVLDSLSIFFQKEEEASLENYELASTLSFISQLLLLLIGVPVLFFVIKRMKKDKISIDQLFTDLDESNRKYVFNSGESQNYEKSNKTGIIKGLMDNLREASDFIQSITRSDLNVEWHGMDNSNIKFNENTISGELITMRDQLIKVKEEETKRFWVTDGLSKFSEIVRTNQDDLKTLCEVLISQVVHYTDSNQGGLFLLNEEEEEKFLELTSCYAYERKKFLTKQIKLGDGLVGQAFLEGETIKMSQIPENYLNITSGLGQALPNNLLLIPLKANERVEGVMELASFKEYGLHHMNFLEKIGDILASAIINAKAAVRTKELLETTQQNEEEMKAQEEEMRQNMEELQATQEEMQRKEVEYLNRITKLEDQLNNS